MNRNDFLHIINNAGKVDRQMTSEIRELIELFPWFQSAHLLLLKGLHNTEDVKFENQLRQSAFHIANREMLYYMLQKSPQKETETKEQEKKTVTEIEETPDNQQVVIETGKNSEDLINKLEKDTPHPVTVVQGSTAVKVSPDQTVVIGTDSETDESASIVFIIDNGETHTEETVIFMDPSFSFADHEELLELDEGVIDLSEKEPVAEDETKSVHSEEERRKQVQSELIDKFIMANPRIEPVREKSDKPVEDISKPFVEAKGNFVTETLAKIYITQGYYSRAIDIYEKLCLKFPEKSSYFATQIEKVKALIK